MPNPSFCFEEALDLKRLGSLLGLGGSAGSSSVPTWSGAALGAGAGGLSIPMFASGTSSAPGVLAMVGEKGPELVNLPRGAQVFKPVKRGECWRIRAALLWSCRTVCWE